MFFFFRAMFDGFFPEKKRWAKEVVFGGESPGPQYGGFPQVVDTPKWMFVSWGISLDDLGGYPHFPSWKAIQSPMNHHELYMKTIDYMVSRPF